MKFETMLNVVRKYCEYDLLSVTEVGSRMWKMEELSSDHDICVVFRYPVMKMIRGYVPQRTMKQRKIEIDDVEFDIQFIEVGHLVNLLILGNINAIWMTTSPIKYLTDRKFIDIELFVRQNPAKSIIRSCKGMAISQWADSKKRANVKSPVKSKLTAMRTLQFGINYLRTGELVYDPYKADHEIAVEEFHDKVLELESVEKESILPNYCSDEDLRDELEKIRMSDLHGDF